MQGGLEADGHSQKTQRHLGTLLRIQRGDDGLVHGGHWRPQLQQHPQSDADGRQHPVREVRTRDGLEAVPETAPSRILAGGRWQAVSQAGEGGVGVGVGILGGYVLFLLEMVLGGFVCLFLKMREATAYMSDVLESIKLSASLAASC